MMICVIIFCNDEPELVCRDEKYARIKMEKLAYAHYKKMGWCSMGARTYGEYRDSHHWHLETVEMETKFYNLNDIA